MEVLRLLGNWSLKDFIFILEYYYFFFIYWKMVLDIFSFFKVKDEMEYV